MPYPFTRGLFLWGTPITVSRDASPEDMERLRQELETQLNRMTHEAEAAVLRTSP